MRLGLLAVAGVIVATLAGAAAQADSASDARIFQAYRMKGAVMPFRDPSIIRQGDTYYVFGTDMGDTNFESIPIRCSKDKETWIACGNVFRGLPAWLREKVPGIGGIWAPDISYFHGLYHLYYAGSTFGSNRSVIALATNTTLDRHDPNYKWIDHGVVLESKQGDDFNAIDPNILVVNEGEIWLSYGSFWTGLKQRRIDPDTGMLSKVDTKIYALAERKDVLYHPIEASSLVQHDGFYYLFASFDLCCVPDPHNATYRIMVGRGKTPHGPFVDRKGVAMMDGGGTELLAGDGKEWSGPGGQTVYIDPKDGDLIVFHALRLPQGQGNLFVNKLTWIDGWPSIVP
ncbi:MAG TPA: arabinan endo-1,5-alpha-L-arabinosidase [Magnetospirillaceae bacterium]|jgi:arabinan endo-1,5-alpha-L-arabinosidase